jgi:hypothetical protein
MIRPRASSPLYSLAPCGAALLLLTGCHAQQVTAQFRLGYDEAIRRLYEHHALMNLACAEEGAFFVQMAYSNFGSQIAVTGSISAQFTIIDTVDAPYGRDQVVVDISDQTFAPTLSASQTNVLGLTASPAPNQHAIRELYQAEVNKPPEERFFFMTANPKGCAGRLPVPSHTGGTVGSSCLMSANENSPTSSTAFRFTTPRRQRGGDPDE